MKMKHLITVLLATFAAAWIASAADDTTTTPAAAAPPDTTAAPPDAAAADAGNNAPAPAAVPEAAAAEAPEPVMDTNLAAGVTPGAGLILNFHDAPLNAVLNYLSERAGLIIMSDADLKGKVSVVAKQPVTTNEIVDVLAEQLAKNNYAVALNGRTLTIMAASSAKTSAGTPVLVQHGNPTNIPANDKIVTEILPVHTLVPAQLVKDLDPLIPPGDTVTANDAGSAIIMTASQRDVRRISEIIGALDSSAISDVQVFPLKYADAKAVAAELKEIFQSADSDVTRATTRNNFAGRGGRGGGGFPFGGGGFPGGGGGGAGEDSAKNAQTHAVFVSDDQMNAVVASAPPDYMPSITNVIEALDKPSQDITEIRVFRLKHADPQEIADELSNLFPSTQNSSTSGQGNRFMGFRFGGGGGGNNSQSTRMKAQTTVLAVADRRTQSVVVTAAKDTMEQIKGMITDLDEGPMGVQHVFALPIDSADPASVQETMTTLFQGTQSRSQTTTTTALSARQTANNNSQASTTSTTSGFAGSSGSGLH